MRIRAHWLLVLGGVFSIGCVGSGIDPGHDAASPAVARRRDAALPAIEALRRGSFVEAGQRAGEAIAADGANPHARLVRAVVRYEKTMHQLSLDGRSIVMGGLSGGGVNQKYLSTTLGDAESDLAGVASDLEAASKDPGLAVELCIACWEVDWNGDGEIDERDHRLLEIEEDEAGNPIPEGDPRRRPTFRFDAGDVAWARAFVGFQRAALDVVLAYDFSEATARQARRQQKIVLRLAHPERIAEARKRILEGLDQSDEARRSYLAETDDDREWVPNPRQKSHPLPLPVDRALYDTWEGVVGDVRRIVRGDEGVSVAELTQLFGEPSEQVSPRGFIDLGGMLAHPHDITLDIRELDRLDRGHDAEGALKTLLGDHYVSSMKPSPLPRRLLRMKGEVEQHKEGIGRKLRYLFWLN
jgi:hypothetical protein